jgi:hypothetical protein
VSGRVTPGEELGERDDPARQQSGPLFAREEIAKLVTEDAEAARLQPDDEAASDPRP